MGSPDNRRALSPRNVQCYEHYMECAAVGQFPDDAVVRRNAGLIRFAEMTAQRIHQWEMLQHQKIILSALMRTSMTG